MTAPGFDSVRVTPDELQRARAWREAAVASPDALPFSFAYGGAPSREFLATCTVERTARVRDDGSEEWSATWSDRRTGLEVRCVGVQYADFPTVEWTLYFRNGGDGDTPIMSDIMALDASFVSDDERECVLHHHRGSPCTAADYEPLTTPLAPTDRTTIRTTGGRSTQSDLSYFNVEWRRPLPRPDGWVSPTPVRTAVDSTGVIIAIGWPGQWAADFEREEGDRLHVRAGQERTHFTLHPGEEVRSPLIALQFWTGDRMRSHNVWRRWMRAHNSPMAEGSAPPPHLAACSSHQYAEMIEADEAKQIRHIDRYLEEGLELDYWWMDAGWYVNKKGWPNVGTWEVDTERFPRGLRAITDHARSRGVRSIVWFEPERVTSGTWLFDTHPEWLLGEGGTRLLDLGNPEARAWLTDHVDRLITEQGIDLYRQDFNTDPLDRWRANDAPDRQGITEIRYVAGLLAFWDELRRRHLGMIIDTCASGGRRNDIETLRRAIPLHRSDYIIEPLSQQCHTYGISFWIPAHGTGTKGETEYAIRSTMCPCINAVWDVRRPDLDYDLLRRLMGDWRRIAEYLVGDYYPLVSYSLEPDAWMAWQYDRPDLGGGVVQAFRRPDSPFESARLTLFGLDPGASYAVTDLDTGGRDEASGAQVGNDGLHVAIETAPGSAMIVYERLADPRH